VQGSPNLLPRFNLNFKPAPVAESPPAFSLNNFLASGDIGAAATSPGKTSDLAAFGLSPNPTSRSVLNKDSILRLVTIDSPNGAYIVLRVEPLDERSGSLGEKFLFDAMRAKEANWTEPINMNKSTLHWYENNVAKVNNKGWNIRLFSIHLGVPGLPELDSVINLAQYICAQINSVKANNTTTRVDQTKLYWIPREECRWADILGWDGALRKLLRKTGPPTGGYFESNFSLIRSYFHKGTLPQQLGAFIHAPDEELHPMFRKSPPCEEKESEEENEDVDDNSDAKPPAEEAEESNDDGASLGADSAEIHEEEKPEEAE